MRYLRWLSLPLLAAAGALLLQARGPAPFVSGPLPGDPKLRRTLKLSELAGVLGPAPASAPAPRLDRDDLALDVAIDPGRLELMRYRDNRREFKVRPTDVALAFDRQPARPATLILRGASTLKSSDKLNFNVTMLRRLDLSPDLKFKHFYLTAMAQDPHEIATVFGYRLLRGLGLFHCHFQYVRLSLNDQPQGMYLLVEPPSRAIRRRFDDVAAIHRRQKPNLFETYWTNGRYNASTSLGRFQSLNLADRLDDGVAQYSAVLDLDSYLAWTAFNSIVRNCDSLDEVYLYERRPKGREVDPAPLAVMAWDCDDLAAPAPLPGSLADPLLFSCLDRFDKVIQREPALYALYRRKLADLLAGPLGADRLLAELDSVRALRDGLDDGLPADVQARRRLERAAYAEQVRSLLLARRAELLQHVNPPSSPSRPAEK